jgi:hypothetical protein
MSELWIPQPNKQPNVTNLYDMMVVFQEKIDHETDRESKLNSARFALHALAMCLEELKDDGYDEITVVSGLAIIDSTEDDGSLLLANDIGLRGNVSDVCCVQLESHVPVSLALGMEVMSVFPASSPDENGIILGTAKAPINNIRYIETQAA